MLFIILVISSVSQLVQAQGRSIFNSDFEDPDVDSNTPPRSSGSVGSWGTYDASVVPFWQTSASDNLIEIGKSSSVGGPYGFDAQSGTQMAELNANFANNLFFDVCLFAGESINWSLWHRGRSGVDSMGIIITQPNGINLPTIRMGTPNTVWQQVTGAYSNTTGMNGNLRFTFYAISTAGGDLSVGNLMDNVTITGLAPLVEFVTPALADSEQVAMANPPQVRVNGLVGPSGATLSFNVKGGTATPGVDYTLPVTLNIPSGNYFNTVFDLPFTVDDDGIPEGDETIFYELAAAVANDPSETDPLILNTSCGVVTNDTISYTLQDQDVPLASQSLGLDAEATCAGNTLRLGAAPAATTTAWLEYRTEGTAWQRLATLAPHQHSYTHQTDRPLVYYRLVQADGARSQVQALYNACLHPHTLSVRNRADAAVIATRFYAQAGTARLQVHDMLGG